jgi:hypothetical protein
MESRSVLPRPRLGAAGGAASRLLRADLDSRGGELSASSSCPHTVTYLCTP